jgi:hypothetical protein
MVARCPARTPHRREEGHALLRRLLILLRRVAGADHRRGDVEASVVRELDGLAEDAARLGHGPPTEGVRYAWLAGLNEVRNVTWVDLPTSHWPMWSKPQELAAIIGDVAKAHATDD